jgi:hypothetical protein
LVRRQPSPLMGPAWPLAAELLLFMVMAYDCYVTICQLLLYGSWSPRASVAMAGVMQVSACLVLGQHLPDVTVVFLRARHDRLLLLWQPPLPLLYCSSTYVNDVMTIVDDIFTVMYFCSLWCSMASSSHYSKDLHGWEEVVHLIHVLPQCVEFTMYYVTIIHMHLNSDSSCSQWTGEVLAVLYSEFFCEPSNLFPKRQGCQWGPQESL